MSHPTMTVMMEGGGVKHGTVPAFDDVDDDDATLLTSLSVDDHNMGPDLHSMGQLFLGKYSMHVFDFAVTLHL